MTKMELCGACADWKDVGAVAGVIGRCRNAESVYLGYVFAYGRRSCSWWKCPACFNPYCGLDAAQPDKVLGPKMTESYSSGSPVTKSGPYDFNEDGTPMAEKASVLEEAAPEMEPAPWQVPGKPARVHMSQVSADEPPWSDSVQGVVPVSDSVTDAVGWDEPVADEPAPVVKAAPVFIGEGTFPLVLAAGQKLVDAVRNYGLYLGPVSGTAAADVLLNALEAWDKATGQYEGSKRP